MDENRKDPGSAGQQATHRDSSVPAASGPISVSTGGVAAAEPASGWSVASSSATASQPAVAQEKPREKPIVGPLILIPAGVLFLLNSLDIVSWDVPLRLLELWPLLLVAAGLHLLIGNRNRWISVAIWAVTFAVGVIYVATNGGFQSAGDLARMDASANLDGATSAVVQIEPAQVTLSVDGTESSMLATADLEYYTGLGQPVQTTGKSGNEATLHIIQPESKFVNFNDDRPRPTWNIHLNPQVPTSLNIKAGAGNSTLDLARLKLTDLTLKAGVGNVRITLPAEAGSTRVEIDGGIGNLDLVIPAGVEARIEASAGLGNTTVDGRFVKDGDTYTSSGYDGAKNRADITIRAGIGNVSVQSR